MSAPNAIQENLPLTEATCYILLSLSPKPRHGYAIMKDVQSLSQDRVMLSTGTLYGALKRLLEAGWIERIRQREANTGSGDTGRPRKAYALTDLGRRVLEAEIARIENMATIARLRTTGASA